jgi:hypothetical protein
MRRRILSLAAALIMLAPTGMGPLPAVAGTDGLLGTPSMAAAGEAPRGTALASPEPAPAGVPAEFPEAAPHPQVPAGYERVGETQSLRLYINRDDSKLIVEDKRNGKLWTSNPLTPLSDQKSLLDDALFLLNYTNARRQMTNLASSASERPDLSYQAIPNGIRVTYDIQKLKLKITIDYALKEEPRVDGPGTTPYLEVTIPEAGIAEQGDCSVVTSTTCFMIQSIEVLPLLGAAPVGAQGYLVIPDEAGAIVTFKHEYPQYRQRYSAQIYGTDAASQAFLFTSGGGGARGTQYFGRPRLPLWGLVVKGEGGQADTAYAAVVTKGEFQANINAYLAGYITNANRASVDFIYRRQASIPRRRTLFVNRIEENWMRGDRQVRYVFLTGDEANYAGVAKVYRNYLMKEKGLQRLPMEAPRPLLDLFMGITRRSAFREDFVPMTTFDQGITIIKAFLDKGIRNFDVNLIGWNDDGYRGRWPRRYPAEEDLGGNAGLRRLIDFAHKNGVRVYLEDEYVFAYTFSSGGIFGQIPYVRNLWPNWSYGFNTRWDTIRGVNKLPVFGGAGIDLYLLNPVIARTRYLERDLPKHKSFSADGLEFRSFGSRIYSDTNDRYPLSREQVAQEWMKMVDRARQELGHAMVYGANAYVLGHVDRVYEAPVNALDAFGDVEVPIYHIATHGLVTRTTYAVNLRNDPKTEFLRQVEWGMQPVYQLTHQPSADLIRTNYNFLYTSQYTEWLDPAVKEYAQMRDEFGYLNGLFITNHEILARRVNRVTFEDGSQLIVNYNPVPYEGPEGRVEAYGYLLKKGTGTR